MRYNLAPQDTILTLSTNRVLQDRTKYRQSELQYSASLTGSSGGSEVAGRWVECPKRHVG